MAGPTLSEHDYGAPSYTDDVDNWRAQDVSYIQRRSVLRFPSQVALEASSHTAFGSVAYVANDADSDDDIEPGADPYLTSNLGTSLGANNWKRVVQSTYLRIPGANDTTTSVRLRHDSASSGLSLKSGGAVVAESRLEVGAEQVVIESSGVMSLKNGANTITVQANSSGKLAVSAAVVSSAVEVTNVSTATLTATGAASVGSLSVTGALSVGSLSVTTATMTNATVTNTATIATVASGNVRLTAAGLSHTGGTASFGITGTALSAFAPGGFSFRRSTAEDPVQVAGVVVSATPPSGNYPEGTIWLEVA
jgi:hypothetical protein